MRVLVCVLVAVMMLAGAGLYAMEPAGAGAGQAEPAKERAKVMPFKSGSEPAKGLDDIVWGADVREFPKLTLSSCGVYEFQDLCLYRAEDAMAGPEDVEVGLLFWRDRLFGVELTTQGRKNWAPFRNMVFEEFGGPPVPATGNEFQWEGEKALAHLSYSYRSRKVSLLIVSVEIGDEMGRASGLEAH